MAKTVAARIRAEIRARKLTAYRVAKDTGLNETTVHRLMRGEGEPTLDNAEVLIHFLGWRIVGPGAGSTKRGARP